MQWINFQRTKVRYIETQQDITRSIFIFIQQPIFLCRFFENLRNLLRTHPPFQHTLSLIINWFWVEHQEVKRLFVVHTYILNYVFPSYFKFNLVWNISTEKITFYTGHTLKWMKLTFMKVLKLCLLLREILF